jgi:DNA-binding protein HU-beta
MTEPKTSRFVSRGFKGVKVRKGHGKGASLLAGRGAAEHAQAKASKRAINKQDLVIAVADSSGLSRADARKAVAAVFDSIARSLKNGDEVRLVGFGTFSVAGGAATSGTSPRTGETMPITLASRLKFNDSGHLKDVAS